MSRSKCIEFDLAAPAANGLRRGRTTGSCATAAVTAALSLLLQGKRCRQVQVMLPGGLHYLNVPIQDVQWLSTDAVRAEVLKDGGDDPDCTHGATLYAEVRRNSCGEVRFFAGRGVGTATQPGLRVAVGEPAINPVPRAMMRAAVAAMSDDNGGDSNGDGFDLAIGCENGEEIAKKTFNPRLGILGGISILGTSGIVEPMSLASWIASIEVYVRVALGGDAQSVAYLPGKIGRGHARKVLGLPDKCAVQIANFLGETLDFTERVLAEEKRRLPLLWLLGHPGKLAKVLDGAWDTHSSKSNMAMQSVARVAAELGWPAHLVAAMQSANTVEAIMQSIKHEPGATSLWREIEQRIAVLAQARAPSVDRVEVRLFDLHARALGQGVQ